MQRFIKRWNCPGGYRQVLKIAFPLILSTGTWSVQHFVDRMFLTWYSPETIAASAPAGFLNFTLTALFTGTVGFVGVFVAQYYGARRLQRIGPVMWQGLYLSILGGFLMLSLIPLSPSFFHFVGHDPSVQLHEIHYFNILCLGGFPVIAASAFSGFFTGLGRTWPVMWVNLISTLANLILDYMLIFGNWGFPEMGIRGAATASVLAAVCSFLIFFFIIFSRKNNDTFHVWKGRGIEKELLIRVIWYGLPSGIQFFLDMAGFTIFVLLVGRLGMINLAATNIALNINVLAFLPMTGTGMAVSVLVGQYLGKENSHLATVSVYSGFHMTFIYMTSIAAAYVLVPDLFIVPFSAGSDPIRFNEIYRTTVVLLRFVAVYSIFDTLNIIFASAIKGAGDTRFIMLMIMLLTTFVLIGPTYAAITIFNLGLMTVWVIATIYIILLGLIFYSRFIGGKWQAMRVIEKHF